MTKQLTEDYWNQRYHENELGWDLGVISPPLKAYFDQIENKALEILIPGAGSGYECAYLHEHGFTNVHILDFAPEAMKRFLERNPSFPKKHAHVEDFFAHSGHYDLVIEQTLFCALDPSLRSDYAQHVASLLKPSGKLVGLMFNRDFEGGPPFGGNREEYLSYFDPYFGSIEMNPCYNSIPPRQGNELFVKMEK